MQIRFPPQKISKVEYGWRVTEAPSMVLVPSSTNFLAATGLYMKEVVESWLKNQRNLFFLFHLPVLKHITAFKIYLEIYNHVQNLVMKIFRIYNKDAMIEFKT